MPLGLQQVVVGVGGGVNVVIEVGVYVAGEVAWGVLVWVGEGGMGLGVGVVVGAPSVGVNVGVTTSGKLQALSHAPDSQ